MNIQDDGGNVRCNPYVVITIARKVLLTVLFSGRLVTYQYISDKNNKLVKVFMDVWKSLGPSKGSDLAVYTHLQQMKHSFQDHEVQTRQDKTGALKVVSRRPSMLKRSGPHFTEEGV